MEDWFDIDACYRLHPTLVSGHSQLFRVGVLILAYSVPESPKTPCSHDNPAYANANVNVMLFHAPCEYVCSFVAHSPAVQHISSPTNYIVSFRCSIRPVEAAILTSLAKQLVVHQDDTH